MVATANGSPLSRRELANRVGDANYWMLVHRYFKHLLATYPITPDSEGQQIFIDKARSMILSPQLWCDAMCDMSWIGALPRLWQ